MKIINRKKYTNRILKSLLVLLFVLSFLTSGVNAQDTIWKYYTTDINLFSFLPNEPLDSYQWCGSGNTGSGGSVGLDCYDEIHKFSVTVHAQEKDKKFLVDIVIKPHATDHLTKAKSFGIDISNLEPRSFELAKNDDGRVYMLTLTPKISIIDKKPVRANEAAFHLDRWVFNPSMVILNDENYVGKIGAIGGPLAFIKMAELGNIEFSLIPFRDAELLGMLKDGQINILLENGTTIDIYNVKNGVYETELPGGPYELWVRWQPATESVTYKVPDEQEWIRQIKSQFAEKGITLPSDKELQNQYELFKNKQHYILASGVGPIKPNDKIE